MARASVHKNGVVEFCHSRRCVAMHNNRLASPFAITSILCIMVNA